MTKAEQALEVKQDTLSEASKSAERTSVGWYKLHNDLDLPVTAVIAASRGGTRLRVLVIAPGTTSEQFDDGTDALFYQGTGPGEVYDCVSGCVWYHSRGDLRGNQVNNLSWFQ